MFNQVVKVIVIFSPIQNGKFFGMVEGNVMEDLIQNGVYEE